MIQDRPVLDGTSSGERIAKVIARAGICSRRDAEQLITTGRVAVNGSTIVSPALNVTSADLVAIDGQPLPVPQAPRLWRYHKPAGLVVTHRDEKARPTVFDHLPADLPRVMSVGRLDLNTEGLLLLTNDGSVARLLELPATGWVRRYRVRVHGTPSQRALDELDGGITVEGVHYGPITAAIDKMQGTNAWLTFALREGKNREIKKVCDHLGLQVTRLIRTSFGPFQLGDMKSGSAHEVAHKVLSEQLGGRLPGSVQQTAKSRAHRRR